MYKPSSVPLWSTFFAAVISSSCVQGAQKLAAPPPTSAACAWMVVVDSSTMMLPSASKVMPGAVCTSGGREGSRRSAPSLPLTFSCTQGTRLASAFASSRPEEAGLLNVALYDKVCCRRQEEHCLQGAGRAWRQASINHDWAGVKVGVKRGAHACPAQSSAEGRPFP